LAADSIKVLFSKSSLYSAGNIFRQLVNFILIPVYTTFLSTEDYGIIGLMSMTAGIILQITKTPVAHGFVRFFYDKNFSGKKDVLLFSSMMYALFFSGLFFIIFFQSAEFLG
jgi:O-antigen/teichoic acid export membrane protein